MEHPVTFRTRKLSLLAPVVLCLKTRERGSLPAFFSFGTVHKSRWPEVSEIPYDEAAEGDGDILVSIIEEIRKKKTHSQVSMKHPISVLNISGLHPRFQVIFYWI